MHVVIVLHNRCIYRCSGQLAISCLDGSVGRTLEYCTLIFLSSVLLVQIKHATFIIVTIEKTFVFIFIKFSPFAMSFSILNKFHLFGDNNILS